MVKVLAAVFPRPDDDDQFARLDASGTLPDLVQTGLPEGCEVQTLVRPQFAAVESACKDFAPDVLYIAGQTSYDQTSGTVGALQFADGPGSSEALVAACSAIPTVYSDCSCSEDLGPKLQAAGVQNAITWPANTAVPAATASQFCHTFFTAMLSLKATAPEAFAFANHVTTALCGTSLNGQFALPPLPRLHSEAQATLPDNSSVVQPILPGIDPSAALATAVPGWSDIRLLAPRAELRLLLTGDTTLIDSSRLSYLGEALRALLVFEMRGLVLLNMEPSSRTPANLPIGCEALRCEVRTTSGADVSAILGGQPTVLGERALVEHALRMTLVADSLSLQFRLPPPTMPIPQPRYSVTVAGGVPVVDALVLTSVWAVQVLRSLSQVARYRPILSLGLGAVGAAATLGCTEVDVQRLKMIVTGAPGVPKQAPMGSGGLAHAPSQGLPASQRASPAPPADMAQLGGGADGGFAHNEITAGA